jgi:hypothetical protein
LWWPVTIEPGLDLPLWLPLVFIAPLAGLAATLSGGRWLRFVVASSVGTFAGLCTGYAIWPPTDAIAGSYAPFTVVVATLAVGLVSLVTSLVGRKVSVSNEKGRGVVRFALLCCVAVGPATLALTPPLVAHRLARNDRIAARRFGSLKSAVEQTMAEGAGPERICDGQVLKQHYSGPPFSEQDWRFIAGNYVTQDGYVFGIYCHEKGGYTIDAWPVSERVDGTRRFCTDESRVLSCAMEWNRSRYACVACTK